MIRGGYVVKFETGNVELGMLATELNAGILKDACQHVST